MKMLLCRGHRYNRLIKLVTKRTVLCLLRIVYWSSTGSGCVHLGWRSPERHAAQWQCTYDSSVAATSRQTASRPEPTFSLYSKLVAVKETHNYKAQMLPMPSQSVNTLLYAKIFYLIFKSSRTFY
jgi:hypothetical protein